MHKQRPVGLAVGDVPGQVVVVALAPQGAGQQHELLARRQVGQQRPAVGRERAAGGHGARHGRTVSGRGHR